MFKKIFDLLPLSVKRAAVPSCFDVSSFVQKAAAKIPQHSLVLDAGAGQCRHKPFFSNQRYVAVDAAWGDSTWDYRELDAIADILKLPFKDRCFDYAICTQVLEHVPEPEALLCELLRVLTPKGTLYLSAPQGWCVHQAPHDYFRFTDYGLRYLLEKAGFEIVFIEPSCGYFGYLANRLAFMPRILFERIKSRPVRCLFFPLEAFFYLAFGLVFPFILNSMDFLDNKREFTLNYFLCAKRPG